MKAFQDILLGPLKAVLMRALQQQLSKYIHNIELEELGLLGGDVVLENLEIRKEILHESLRIPTDYDFSRWATIIHVVLGSNVVLSDDIKEPGGRGV